MTRLATEKQLAFIRELVGDEAFASSEGALRALDVKTASLVIDELKQARAVQRRAASQARSVPEGFHYYGGIVYRVRRSESGNMYHTEFVEHDDDTWSFEYRGCRGVFNRLCEMTLMTREQAQEFGRGFGICVRCGALLTDNDRVGKDGLTSVQRGLGPVCFEKWGEA